MQRSVSATVDIVMLGSFGVWTRGTLQSRALPLARAVSASTGLRVSIVTTPWDDPGQAGVHQTIDGVDIFNTAATDLRHTPTVVRDQLRLLRGLGPRLIHVMKPKAAAGMTADLLLRSRQAPTIVVDYDDWEGDGGWNEAAGYPMLVRRVFSYQERRLLRCAGAATAASTLLEHRARQLRHARGGQDVVYLPNGLEREWMVDLRRAAEQHRRWDRPALTLYSRFAEFSPNWMRDVISRIDRELHMPIELHVIGSEREPALISPDLRRIQPRWHGYLDRNSIPVMLASGTVALYPYEDNLINRSKQSVKLIELMASGAAVVASNVGDVRRIGGGAVVAAPAGDKAAFAEAATRLLRDSAAADNLGRLARSRAERFSIDRLAERLLELYSRVGVV